MKSKIIKKITIVLCFLMFTPQLVQGQEIDNSYNTPPHELNYMYLKKHKTQKTIGWICLGSGVAMIVGGLALNLSNNVELRKIICSNNQLNSLNLSNNKKLQLLWCENAQLTSPAHNLKYRSIRPVEKYKTYLQTQLQIPWFFLLKR